MRRSLTAFILAVVILTAALPSQWLEAAQARGVYKVTKESLPVRKEPGQNSTIKGYLSKGTLVQVSDEQFGWMKISGPSVSGWTAGHYLTPAQSGGTASPSLSSGSGQQSSGEKTAVITDKGVRVRSGPGTGYSVLGSVTKGDRVTVLEAGKQWSRVSASSALKGWVSTQYISMDSTKINVGSGSGPRTGSQSGGIRGKLIVIDPGHGGNDPGMIGTTWGTEEKIITLSTSKLLADELRARGARVLLTRTKNSQKPSLAERVRITAAAGADVFVSVHYNSSPSKSTGSMVFFYSKSKDVPLARAIESPLEGLSLRSNGIAFGDYHVLRESRIPSVLLELGFLSNQRDEAEVRTDRYQRKTAAAIASGLAAYFSR